jgi:ribosomal protein L14
MLGLGIASCLQPKAAWADASIAGQWQADMGNSVLLVMDVIADGHWFSTTVHDEKVVAELAGTYTQTKTNDATGTLVFTPQNGGKRSDGKPIDVETDAYVLSNNGETLTLTSDKQPMKFQKQAFAK